MRIGDTSSVLAAFFEISGLPALGKAIYGTGICHLGHLHEHIPYLIVHDVGERHLIRPLPSDETDPHEAIRQIGARMLRNMPVVRLYPLEEYEIVLKDYALSDSFKKKIFAEFKASLFIKNVNQHLFRSILIGAQTEKLTNASGYMKRTIK